MLTRSIVVVLALALSAQQTPTQLLDQIDALLKQLRATVAPAPAVITTAAALEAAVKSGGNVRVGAGTFTVNLTIASPTVLTGAGRGQTVLVPKDQLLPTLSVTGSDVIAQDMTIRNGAPDRETIVVGSPSATSADAQPHRVRLQRLSVEALAGGHRGVALHGVDLTLDDSSVVGYYEKGRDSQAVWILNGPGPYAITNSVLEASGENILVGGADPGIVGMNPADITIRGNTIRKPDSYRTLGTVKNLLELKTGLRVVIEGNAFDGNWKDGQAGHAIVFTVRNQDGRCVWCQVDDVTFRGNTLRHSTDGFAVNILGNDDSNPSRQTTRITIDRNLFADSPNGIQIVNGVSAAMIVTSNTFPAITGRFLSFDQSRAKVVTPLTFSRNVTTSGAYGVTGDGSTAIGTPTLTAQTTIVDWSGNVIEMTQERTIPLPNAAGNRLLAAGALRSLLDPVTLKLLTGGAGY